MGFFFFYIKKVDERELRRKFRPCVWHPNLQHPYERIESTDLEEIIVLYDDFTRTLKLHVIQIWFGKCKTPSHTI